MKKINNYIQEKLHINKEYSIDDYTLLSLGDIMLLIGIDCFEISKLELSYYKFIRYDDKKGVIRYTPKEVDSIISNKVIINSNGYFEINEINSYRGIFLSPKGALKFLNEFNKNKNNLKEFLYNNYLDKSDKKFIYSGGEFKYSNINITSEISKFEKFLNDD